jgi:hypothetical protein
VYDFYRLGAVKIGVEPRNGSLMFLSTVKEFGVFSHHGNITTPPAQAVASMSLRLARSLPVNAITPHFPPPNSANNFCATTRRFLRTTAANQGEIRTSD